MKKSVLLVSLLFIAIFLGNLIGDLAIERDTMEFLGREYGFGIPTINLDLKVLVVTLGFQVKVSVAQILLIFAALLSYPRLAAAFFS